MFVVPSAEPVAPGPFDFRHSAALADAAYAWTQLWLAQEGPRRDGASSIVRLAAPGTGDAVTDGLGFPC